MMSLGLYSNVWAESDNDQYSRSRRVNMKIWGGVPSFDGNLSRYQVSYPVLLQLLSYVNIKKNEKKNNMDKMGKLYLAIIFTCGGF